MWTLTSSFDFPLVMKEKWLIMPYTQTIIVLTTDEAILVFTLTPFASFRLCFGCNRLRSVLFCTLLSHCTPTCLFTCKIYDFYSFTFIWVHIYYGITDTTHINTFEPKWHSKCCALTLIVVLLLSSVTWYVIYPIPHMHRLLSSRTIDNCKRLLPQISLLSIIVFFIILLRIIITMARKLCVDSIGVHKEPFPRNYSVCLPSSQIVHIIPFQSSLSLNWIFKMCSENKQLKLSNGKICFSWVGRWVEWKSFAKPILRNDLSHFCVLFCDCWLSAFKIHFLVNLQRDDYYLFDSR